eukprot:CAMPEP_0114693260 /NCGR_PEP_ID=MMETSP0191-20121206/68849_1 /TAXON_ID=126664 /ORGANISM="Sorites sp." /LENGTH=60 /DNA_ID=CAMNT_0001986663 /DNA_START=32 /DNA_END=210 /DNA_ORIENTATION=-
MTTMPRRCGPDDSSSTSHRGCAAAAGSTDAPFLGRDRAMSVFASPASQSGAESVGSFCCS